MTQQVAPLVINVCGGARLCVPANLGQLTAYILLEQEDWFEDEIRFVRRWLRPGMRAIDVGASFGVYTIAMARAVGPGGRVWAFEPTPATADFLQRNLDLNLCANVALRRAAVSDRAGELPFAVGANSELNAVAVDGAGALDVMQVSAVTLDRSAAKEGWEEIDFIKLDVEGHELEAIRGGAEFLAARSPLIMLEIKAGARIDFRALGPLSGMGYAIYRLLPGRLLLAPFDDMQAVDPFCLNLFACKSGRARMLAAQGVLAEDDAASATPSAKDAWTNYVRSAPYARGFAARWPAKAGFLSGADTRAYLEGLAAYGHSHEPGLAPARQLAALAHAYRCVAEALDARETLSRRISYARLAWELGWRGEASDALRRATETLASEGQRALDEPFLAPSPRYERLDSTASPRDWLKCAVIEQYERLRSYSSLWSATTTLATIEPILELPYRSAEMERRGQLVRMLADAQRAPAPSPLLCKRSDENLNPEFWCSPHPVLARAPSGGTETSSILSIIPHLPCVKIVDVGAMWDGEHNIPYAQLQQAVPCKVIGFEPLAEECEKLNRMGRPGCTYLPHVIGDGTRRTFYECNDPMTSSVFEPNGELLAKFHRLEEQARVVATRLVETRRLDDLPEVEGADYLKLDVQGGELLVLQGAVETLRNVLVVHTEAEFAPLYKNQPLFADIDAFLRAQGFALHKMMPVVGVGQFKAAGPAPGPVSAASQTLWCDLVYVPDFMAFDRLSAEQLLKLAVILHENYASQDLAALALEAYDRKTGSDAHERYLGRLSALTICR